MCWIKTGIGIVSILCLGVIREQNGFLFLNEVFPVMDNMGGTNFTQTPSASQNNWAVLSSDPRWLPTTFMIISMAGLTAYILYSFFRKSYVVKVSLLFHVAFLSLAGISIALSLGLNTYGFHMYRTVMKIKYLLEQPFILLLLFPVFYFIEKSRGQSSTGAQ